MNKYWSRITSSARGEAFNPLSFPFLLSTFAYGVGFAFVLPYSNALGQSGLFRAVDFLGEGLPQIWGIIAVLNIVLGLTFLLFNIPPFGKISGLIGFALWVFIGMANSLSGDWLVLVGVSIPNMWFWIWQYLSLSVFRHEDALDKATMEAYDSGRYDDESKPEEARLSRESNRGVDRQ